MNDSKNYPTYLSDEELERLIAMTEAEPMLRPPGAFKDDIIRQVRRKRKTAKNLKLFSYSMKVIAVTAAALGIMLIIPEDIRPENIRTEDSIGYGQIRKTQDDGYTYRLNERMNDYFSQLNGKLNQLVRMEVYYDEKEEE